MVESIFFSLRSGLTFVCGIYVFGATWFLLGTNPEDSVNETVAPQFMVSTASFVCTSVLSIVQSPNFECLSFFKGGFEQINRVPEYNPGKLLLALLYEALKILRPRDF